MPSWVILGIAVAILVIGIAVIVVSNARRTSKAGLERAETALRAREQSLRYRMGTLTAGADGAEAERLIDSAAASLSSARRFRSESAVDEASRTLDLAEAEIDRLDAS